MPSVADPSGKASEAAHKDLDEIGAILEAAIDPIITIDEHGIVTRANPAVQRVFGYAITELVGRNVSILMPSPHRERHDEYLARYIRTGEARVLGTGRELEGQRRDGTTFPLELSLSEVNRGGRRQFVGTIRDISERKQAEAALRSSELRTRAILDAALDVIITIDERGIVESVNPALERLFGYAPSELIGRNISMLMPSPHRERHDEYLARYIRTGEARVLGIGREVEGQRRDGSTFPIELSLSEVGGTGARRFTGMLRDITVRKQAEAALLRADALKDEFLANTSHELRTPLNGIIGIGQSMLDGATGPMSDEQRRNLGMVVASGRRLASLVNDILDFSKLRHKEIVLQRRPTDVHALADLVLTISRTLVAKRPLRLFNRIPADVALVEADDERVQQILFNLVGNAVKFTPGGAIEVTATPEDGWLHVGVSDTGIGIEPSRFEAIFQSFTQGDGSVARDHGGTGLGLAVTKQLVELHGGGITVASEPGAGSTFTFTLPLSPTTRGMLEAEASVERPLSRILSDVSLTAAPAQQQAAAAVDEGHRVLVVDDEPVNVQALVNYLSLAGFSITTAGDGEQALQQLASDGPFDLVLLDVMMPKLSGLEVCARIRERCSAAELPVILLTAKNRVSDLVDGFGAGANDYLTKPFTRDELLARVNLHVELAKINESYSRFVPRRLLQQLGKERIIDVSLGDQVQREMTVMFSDIRDFTRMSERLSPADTFRFVNEYLGAVEPAITGHNGVVDKYIGDAIMALFPDQPDDAIRAALDMLRRVQTLNARRAASGQPAVQIGIGIHTGALMLGTVGANERMDTTVISDAVNLAARVENLTKTYGLPLLITGEAFAALHDPVAIAVRRIDRVLVQGKSQPVVLYEILDAEEAARRAEKQAAVLDLHAGLACFEERAFVDAARHFERALRGCPSDSVAALLLERAKRYIAEGGAALEQGVARVSKGEPVGNS